MIFTVILGLVQNIVFIALMIDAVLIIFQLLSYAMGLSHNQPKKGIIISIGLFIGIFYLDGVIFDVFKIHIVSFPIFLI